MQQSHGLLCQGWIGRHSAETDDSFDYFSVSICNINSGDHSRDIDGFAFGGFDEVEVVFVFVRQGKNDCLDDLIFFELGLLVTVIEFAKRNSAFTSA